MTIAAVVLGFATACSTDGSTGPAAGHAYLRVINATYLDSSAADQPAPYQTAPIDLLIDSVLVSPSFLHIAGNVISDLSDGTGPAPARLNAGYRALPAGIHGFVARLSGLTPQGPSFFTSNEGTQYVPKPELASNTYYTMVIAGKAKPQPVGISPVPVLNAATDFGFSFPLLVDDPFSPPVVAGVLQARFRVVNAAPFTRDNGGGRRVFIFVTRTASLTGIQPLGSAGYRNASPYFNLTAGTVYVSVANADGSVIYLQQQVTFGVGEVRTLVFQSTQQSVPLSGYVPGSSPSDFKITNIKDNQY